MTFDGFYTRWMLEELRPQLLGGRINKIHQPLSHEVHLSIRSQRKNHLLLLSVNAMMARFGLIQEKGDNPEFAPGFTMVLRKHIEGAIIRDIHQVGNDRIVHIDLDARDEIGDQANWRLTLEMMGKHSNLFLVNRQNNVIVDCLKRIPFSQNSYRTLQPGALYHLPPHQDKTNPFDLTLQELDAFIKQLDQGGRAKDLLQGHFQGLSSLTTQEILEEQEQTGASLAEALYHYMTRGQTGCQAMVYQVGNKKFFTPFAYASLGQNGQAYPSLSESLEAYYRQKVQEEKVSQLAGHLLQMLRNEVKKNRDKLVRLEEDLAKTQDADQYRVYGDLLNASLYLMEKGQERVVLENFYEDNKPVTIDLSPKLTPSQNAQAYYKRYNKLKNSIKHIQDQQRSTQEEIDYLENVLYLIEDADSKNLEEIRQELAIAGYLKRLPSKKGKKQTQTAKPYVFYAHDGTRILVGRNNLQNDDLTLRKAKKDYLWLHAQNIPGSHVIIESANPSEETIGQGAMLAAYYSKFRHSATVPVDYVKVAKIRKPNGAKPGFVVYEGQQNTYITPDLGQVEKIQANGPKDKE